MKEKDPYLEMKEIVLKAIHRNGSCVPGYKAVLNAGNIGIFCAVLKEYWADVITMHKTDSFRLFEEFYQVNRDGFNKYGIYYNESADNGRVLVTGNTSGVTISGNAKGWTFGTSRVKAKDRASVRAREKSQIELSEDASCQSFDDSIICCTGFSSVNAGGNSRVFAMGNSSVYAGEHTTVYALGWRNITGTGDAVIKSHAMRNMELLGNATFEGIDVNDIITIKKEQYGQ